jgi:hypothetical protein
VGLCRDRIVLGAEHRAHGQELLAILDLHYHLALALIVRVQVALELFHCGLVATGPGLVPDLQGFIDLSDLHEVTLAKLDRALILGLGQLGRSCDIQRQGGVIIARLHAQERIAEVGADDRLRAAVVEHSVDILVVDGRGQAMQGLHQITGG